MITLYKSFYVELGKLLYSMAMADGKIQDKEVKVLHETIKNRLTSLEDSKDEFGMDMAYTVEFELDFLDENIESTEEAFESFKLFFGANKSEITPKMRKLTYELAYEIANSYRGVNKKEQEVLDKVKALLEL